MGRAPLLLVLLGGGVAGCAKSDTIAPPPGSSGQGTGGDDAAGPGSGGEGPTGEGGGAGDGGATTSTAQTSTGGDGGSAPGPAGSGGGGGGATGGGSCGDGAIDGDEACDGDDLGGATCVTEGFVGGTIACDGACTLDTSGCSAEAACDNGLDDDDDGLTDDEDPGCTTADDDDELVYAPSCDGAGTAVVDLTSVAGLTVDYEGTTDDPSIVNNFTATAGGACPSTPGPEVALRFEVEETIATLVISLDNPGTETGWDPVLYVRSTTCTGTQVGCNDDGDGLASVLVLSNVQPGTYYVFVDGRTAGDVGDFEITLSPS